MTPQYPLAKPPMSTNPARPGWTTTEFWAATVAPTIFLLLSQFNVGHIDTNNPHVEALTKLGSYLLAAIGYGFYALSRGHMKKGAVIANAIKQFVGAAPGIAASLKVAVPQVATPLESFAGEIKAFDPQFSENQVEDLSQIVGNLLKNHTEVKLEPLLQQILDAVKNQSAHKEGLISKLERSSALNTGVGSVTVTTSLPATNVDQVDINPAPADTFIAPSFT